MELNLNKTALENVACRKHVDTAKYSDVHACHLHVPDMAQRNFGEIKPSRPEGPWPLVGNYNTRSQAGKPCRCSNQYAYGLTINAIFVHEN